MVNVLRILDLAFIGLIVFHCYLSPFTKVEESFNIQAVHDILSYGPFDLSNYDHQTFPGAVKRTFVGAAVLSAICKPITFLIPETSTMMVYQFIVRLVLGVLNGYLIVRNRRILHKISRNSNLSLYYAILQYTQFHIVYYSSRTLPNFILLPLVNYALGYILMGDFAGGLCWLSFTAVIFRAEIGVFALSLAFVAIFSFQIHIRIASISLIIGGLMGLYFTLSVDSYFWNEFPSVPEISSLLFNVYEGNSKLWGVEPFNAYFTRYFSSIFCPPTVLLFCVPGLFFKTTHTKENSIRTIGLGSILFVLLMSFQPHKEWRFIIYAVPGLTMLAANGASGFRSMAVSSVIKMVIICSSIMSLFVSLMMLHISSLNYPGGVAITTLNNGLLELDHLFQKSLNSNDNGTDDVAGTTDKHNITVHMDVPACMTGVTLFTQIRPNVLENINVIYDKLEDENLLQESDTWKQFDYVITDVDLDQFNDVSRSNTKFPKFEDFRWKKITSIRGFSGINVYPLISVIRNYHIAIGILKSAIMGNFEPISNLLENVITQNERIFIYFRQDF